MAKKSTEKVVIKEDVKPKDQNEFGSEQPIIPTELPKVEDAPKSKLEQSVEDSKEHVAKGYEDQGETIDEDEEPKVAVSIVEEQKLPKKGNFADSDIKQVYLNPNSNIEHQIVAHTPEQKEADIK